MAIIYDDNYLSIDKTDDNKFEMCYSPDGDGCYYRGNTLSTEDIKELIIVLLKNI